LDKTANNMFFWSASDDAHLASLGKFSAASGQGMCASSNTQFTVASYTPSILPLTPTMDTCDAIALPHNSTYHPESMQPTMICSFVGTPVSHPGYEMDCSPNPFTESLRVNFQEPTLHDAILRLYQAEGRLVLETSVPQGKSSLEMDLEHLSDGIYFLKLESDQYTKAMKVIKLK
jgi:hypothetical protein